MFQDWPLFGKKCLQKNRGDHFLLEKVKNIEHGLFNTGFVSQVRAKITWFRFRLRMNLFWVFYFYISKNFTCGISNKAFTRRAIIFSVQSYWSTLILLESHDKPRMYAIVS